MPRPRHEWKRNDPGGRPPAIAQVLRDAEAFCREFAAYCSYAADDFATSDPEWYAALANRSAWARTIAASLRDLREGPELDQLASQDTPLLDAMRRLDEVITQAATIREGLRIEAGARAAERTATQYLEVGRHRAAANDG